MDKHVWIGIVAAGALATLAGCGAPGERPEAIREAAAIHGQITLGGCLQHDAETGRFVLANAVLPQEEAGVPVRDGTERPPAPDTAPSTTGTVPPALAGPRYFLEPPADTDLQAYSGVQVQVTGNLAPTHEGERPVGTAGTGVQPDAAEAERIEGHIMADEVRLVANTCL